MQTAGIKTPRGTEANCPPGRDWCGQRRIIRPAAGALTGSAGPLMHGQAAWQALWTGYGNRKQAERNMSISSRPPRKRARLPRVRIGQETRVHLDSCPDISTMLNRTQEAAIAICLEGDVPGAVTVPEMDVHEMRRVHLQRLIQEYAGGEQKAFAKRTGCSVGYISQVINGFRNLGPSVARRIEAALQQPRGAMDRDPAELPPEAVELAREWMALPAEAKEEVRAYIRVKRLVGKLTDSADGKINGDGRS